MQPINYWETLEIGDRVVELRDPLSVVRTVCAVSADGHWIGIDKYYGVSKSSLAHAPDSQERKKTTKLSKELRKVVTRAIDAACVGDARATDACLTVASRQFVSLVEAIRSSKDKSP